MELIEALNGGKGALDAWLETQSEVEVREAIKALISPQETLRDKFAAKALVALISNRAEMKINIETLGERIASEEVCRSAYKFADAMLAARNA